MCCHDDFCPHKHSLEGSEYRTCVHTSLSSIFCYADTFPEFLSPEESRQFFSSVYSASTSSTSSTSLTSPFSVASCPPSFGSYLSICIFGVRKLSVFDSLNIFPKVLLSFVWEFIGCDEKEEEANVTFSEMQPKQHAEEEQEERTFCLLVNSGVSEKKQTVYELIRMIWSTFMFETDMSNFVLKHLGRYEFLNTSENSIFDYSCAHTAFRAKQPLKLVLLERSSFAASAITATESSPNFNNVISPSVNACPALSKVSEYECEKKIEIGGTEKQTRTFVDLCMGPSLPFTKIVLDNLRVRIPNVNLSCIEVCLIYANKRVPNQSFKYSCSSLAIKDACLQISPSSVEFFLNKETFPSEISVGFTLWNHQEIEQADFSVLDLRKASSSSSSAFTAKKQYCVYGVGMVSVLNWKGEVERGDMICELSGPKPPLLDGSLTRREQEDYLCVLQEWQHEDILFAYSTRDVCSVARAHVIFNLSCTNDVTSSTAAAPAAASSSSVAASFFLPILSYASPSSAFPITTHDSSPSSSLPSTASSSSSSLASLSSSFRSWIASSSSSSSSASSSSSILWKDISTKEQVLSSLFALPPPSSIACVLPLLAATCADREVRDFGVKSLFKFSDEDFLLFLPQLCQCLKVELYHDSALSRCLLLRAARNPLGIGHFFYWQLQSQLYDVNCRLRQRFLLLIEELLSLLGWYAQDLSRQFALMSNLRSLFDAVFNNESKEDEEGERKTMQEMFVDQAKEDQNKHVRRKLRLWAELKRLNENFECCHLPHDPKIVVRRFEVERGRIMAEGNALFLVFCNADGYAAPVKVLMHCDSHDSRTDVLLAQMIQRLNMLWLSQKLDLRSLHLNAIDLGLSVDSVPSFFSSAASAASATFTSTLLPATSTTSAFPQMRLSLLHVESFYSLPYVGIVHGGGAASCRTSGLETFLKKENPSSIMYSHVSENFTRSLASVCALQYVLGFGNCIENTYITSYGCVYYKDVNVRKFFGNNRKTISRRSDHSIVLSFEAALFVKPKRANFVKHDPFSKYLTDSYLILREHSQELLAFLSLTSAQLPLKQAKIDLSDVLRCLHRDVPDRTAANLLARALDDARVSSVRPYDALIHAMRHT